MENRLHYLDGMRGWAALVVLLSHLFRNLLLPYDSINSVSFQYIMYRSPIYIMFQSAMAVKAFFIISGFSLSYGYFKTKDCGLLKKMAIFRFFRLGIPMLFSAIFAYIFIVINANHNQEAAQILNSKWLMKLYNFDVSLFDAIYGTLTYHLTGFGESYNKYNVGFWTMPYEFQASMVIFTLLTIFGNYRIRYLIYISLIYILRENMFLGFVFGVMLCDLTINKNFQEKFIALIGVLNTKRLEIFGLLILIAYFWATRSIPRFSSIIEYYLINGTFIEFFLPAILLLIATFNGMTARFFSNRISKFLGKISFSLYLIHVPIITSFSCWAFIHLQGSVDNIILLALIIGIPTILITIAVSYLFHQLVEVQIMMYVKRIVMGVLKK
jgi:peptidoglycan/LPS O-acetylase OafA/YrhL